MSMRNLNYIIKLIKETYLLDLLLIVLLVWTPGCPLTTSRSTDLSNGNSNNNNININPGKPPKEPPPPKESPPPKETPPKTITQDSITYVVLTQDNIAEKLTSSSINLNNNYLLWEDIDLTGIQIDPIGGGPALQGFRGKFNGNGKKISKFSLEITSTSSSIKELGFFSSIEPEGKVFNLILENPQVLTVRTRTEIVGILAGLNKGIIQDVTVNNGIIEGGNKIGGLVGQNSGEIISSHVEKTTIRANQEGGGIAGHLEGKSDQQLALISKSSASGRIISIGANVFGGLVGRMTKYSKISMCTANITIDEAKHEKIGGLIGIVNASGELEIIENSYATGNLKGKMYVGGLIGKIDTPITIVQSYAVTNIGKDQSSQHIGLLVGRWTNWNTVSHIKSLYYDKTKKQQKTLSVIGSTDKNMPSTIISTITQGLDPSTITKKDFIDFDFTKTWKGTDHEWPRLFWENN